MIKPSSIFSFNRNLSAETWASRLQWALDSIALLALFGTGELHFFIFGFLIFILMIKVIFKNFYLKEKFLVGLLVLFVVISILLWKKFFFHPIIAATWMAPLAHSLVWLAPPTPYRGWRLGFGFVELILASALTPEIYLPFAIILFVVLGSVALSCNYLSQELKNRSVHLDNLTHTVLPESFVRSSIFSSFLIFVMSIVLFPLLPRSKSSFREQFSQPQQGYTEELNLSQLSRVDDSGGKVLLRIFSKQIDDLITSFYLGLLRSRTLDDFDGTHWKPKKTSPSPELLHKTKDIQSLPLIQVDIVRERLKTDRLPVPYGTLRVQIQSDDLKRTLRRLSNQEWFYNPSFDQRVEYQAQFIANDIKTLNTYSTFDLPIAEHLTVPTKLKTERMQKLLVEIFGESYFKLAPRQKAELILRYFKKNNFQPLALSKNPDTKDLETLRHSKLHPIEQFLFVIRGGHCEWFATATAILLRMSGVPTRMISGFRLSREPVGQVLTLRSTDAHAWLEYYSKDFGWKPLDPTPRITAPKGLWSALEDVYDLSTAYWYRYVVSFGNNKNSNSDQEIRLIGEESLKQKEDELNQYKKLLGDFYTEHRLAIWFFGGILFLGLFLSFLILRVWFPWLLKFNFKFKNVSQEARAPLRRERLKFEAFLKRTYCLKQDEYRIDLERSTQVFEDRYGKDLGVFVKDWLRLYEELRFGKTEKPLELLIKKSKDLNALFKQKIAV